MAAITEEMKTMKRDKTVVWVNKLYSAARTAPWTRNEMYDRIRGQFDGYVRFMTTGTALSPEDYKVRRKELAKDLLAAVRAAPGTSVLSDDDVRAVKRLFK